MSILIHIETPIINYSSNDIIISSDEARATLGKYFSNDIIISSDEARATQRKCFSNFASSVVPLENISFVLSKY